MLRSPSSSLLMKKRKICTDVTLRIHLRQYHAPAAVIFYEAEVLASSPCWKSLIWLGHLWSQSKTNVVTNSTLFLILTMYLHQSKPHLLNYLLKWWLIVIFDSCFQHQQIICVDNCGIRHSHYPTHLMTFSLRIK